MLEYKLNDSIQPKQTRYTFSLTKRGKAIDARLQTAVSVGLVYSIISVHKFEDLIVPRFCWLLFLLHVSCRQSIYIETNSWSLIINSGKLWNKEWQVQKPSIPICMSSNVPCKACMVYPFLFVPSKCQTRGSVLEQLSLPCPETRKLGY
jgi:hypothetical protein